MSRRLSPYDQLLLLEKIAIDRRANYEFYKPLDVDDRTKARAARAQIASLKAKDKLETYYKTYFINNADGLANARAEFKRISKIEVAKKVHDLNELIFNVNFDRAMVRRIRGEVNVGDIELLDKGYRNKFGSRDKEENNKKVVVLNPDGTKLLGHLVGGYKKVRTVKLKPLKPLKPLKR